MKVWVWASAILTAGLTVASCSGGDDGGGGTNPGGTSTLTITIVGQRGNSSFSPNPASAGGRTVVFKNNDVEAHRVVLNDGTIDTGDIPAGGTSRAVVMPPSGANYHCSLHDNMGGAVEPQGGGPPPACADPIYCY